MTASRRTHDRPVLGPVKGRSSSGHPALRGLHLDSACAPAVIWHLTGSGTSRSAQFRSVHASRGSPVTRSEVRRPGACI
jgi:hypothetical protein